MITQLAIENYKSIQALTLDVGRVNVLIGENGCGKSNILEAITFAAAAEANKLDNEFLASRGIRVTEPKLMRSNFEKSYCEKEIKISLSAGIIENYTLKNNNKPYSKWLCNEKIEEIKRNEEILKFIELLDSTGASDTEDDFDDSNIKEESRIFYKFKSEFGKFIIYSPENTALRNLEKEAQIEPLGINGEGLLKLLSVIQYESPEQLTDIQENLELFDWYDSLIIPNELSPLERKLTIQDRYLTTTFDQRSANEGFLFVLFYITLMVSNYTPKIFAIDNIDTSLNPKLCTKLIKVLSDLAKKYDKQFFVTSHNPAILDGIDLGDDEQRLFVVSRNKQGHTRCKRIELKDKPKSAVRERLEKLFEDDKTYTKAQILELFDNSPEDLKLSYALLRGYLGGLPKNF
ncbi:MAG: AAA family ATPase [Methylococcaceae bacterium]